MVCISEAGTVHLLAEGGSFVTNLDRGLQVIHPLHHNTETPPLLTWGLPAPEMELDRIVLWEDTRKCKYVLRRRFGQRDLPSERHSLEVGEEALLVSKVMEKLKRKSFHLPIVGPQGAEVGDTVSLGSLR